MYNNGVSFLKTYIDEERWDVLAHSLKRLLADEGVEFKDIIVDTIDLQQDGRDWINITIIKAD